MLSPKYDNSNVCTDDCVNVSIINSSLFGFVTGSDVIPNADDDVDDDNFDDILHRFIVFVLSDIFIDEFERRILFYIRF